MKEHRVHLPIAGERGVRADDEAALTIVPDAARKPLPQPTIATAGAGALEFARALRHELAQSGRAARVWIAETRTRGGVEHARNANDEMILRASASDIDRAIDTLVATDDAAAALTIAVGAPFVAGWRADASVLITRGVPALEWDGSIREMRGRFEIVLSEPRPQLARELVKQLVSS